MRWDAPPSTNDCKKNVEGDLLSDANKAFILPLAASSPASTAASSSISTDASPASRQGNLEYENRDEEVLTCPENTLIQNNHISIDTEIGASEINTDTPSSVNTARYLSTTDAETSVIGNDPASRVALIKKYAALTKLRDITATCKDDLATADEKRYSLIGWIFDGYNSKEQAAFKARLGTFTENCQVLYPNLRRGLASTFDSCRARLGIPDMTTDLIVKRPAPVAEVERPFKRARDQEFLTTPAVPLDETISIGVTDASTGSCSALVKYVKQDERGQVIYVNGDQEMFVEAAGLMARLYGRNGKKLWADLEEDISVRKVKVSAMKGVKTLLDKRALRDIVSMLPIIGIKKAALEDVWLRLGGDIAECPSSHDSIADSDKLHELAKIFQVDPHAILTLHRRHALTPEEKAVLTIKGDHKQLLALVDIARMVDGKNQNDAAQQVRNILKKDRDGFIGRVLKASFGEGPTQWAGDIYTAARLVVRLADTDVWQGLKPVILLGMLSGVTEDSIMEDLKNAPVVKRALEREESSVLRLLNRHGFQYSPQVRIEGKFADAVVALASGVRAVLEVDEKQHKNYGLPSEVSRMLLIKKWAEEEGGVTWLLRFNPHGFHFGKRRIPVTWKTRAETLVNTLRQAKAHSVGTQTSAFYVVFLYYDSDDEGCPLIINDPHVPATLRASIRHFDLASQTLENRK